MLKKITIGFTVIVGLSIIIPFLAAMLGLGGQGFLMVGWVFPMIALYYGGPIIAFLFLLNVIVHFVKKNKKDDSSYTHESLHWLLKLVMLIIGLVVLFYVISYFATQSELDDSRELAMESYYLTELISLRAEAESFFYDNGRSYIGVCEHLSQVEIAEEAADYDCVSDNKNYRLSLLTVSENIICMDSSGAADIYTETPTGSLCPGSIPSPDPVVDNAPSFNTLNQEVNQASGNQIETILSDFRKEAEAYFMANNTYEGLCASDKISQYQKMLPRTQACNDVSRSYFMGVDMGDGTFYCVDQMGTVSDLLKMPRGSSCRS